MMLLRLVVLAVLLGSGPTLGGPPPESAELRQAVSEHNPPPPPRRVRPDQGEPFAGNAALPRPESYPTSRDQGRQGYGQGFQARYGGRGAR